MLHYNHIRHGVKSENANRVDFKATRRAFLKGLFFYTSCSNPLIFLSKKYLRRSKDRLKYLVGVRGFEPPASWSRTKHSTKLSHTPKNIFTSNFSFTFGTVPNQAYPCGIVASRLRFAAPAGSLPLRLFALAESATGSARAQTTKLSHTPKNTIIPCAQLIILLKSKNVNIFAKIFFVF